MKTAEQIAQEIKKHKPIDKTNVMYDETWEDYMRDRKMTREEAIDLLDNLIGMVEDNHNSDYDMALKMAIKALNSNRFISLDVYRQVAKERDIAIEQLHELGYEFGQKIAPRKGHWIEHRDDYGEITHWHCSNCYDDSGFITTCKWDYCPNCGSDNREVVEE